jgi:hypothetical protein
MIMDESPDDKMCLSDEQFQNFTDESFHLTQEGQSGR